MGKRSFDYVDNKVLETSFFLEKMASTKDPSHAQYYLSAFISAARSITLTLQTVMSEEEGFEEWYSNVQNMLKEDEASRFFVQIRNASIHIGVNTMLAGKMKSMPNGEYTLTYYFRIYDKSINIVPPDKDIVSACRDYFIKLLLIIKDTYNIYDHLIDPQQYYTLANIRKIGRTVEDIEEELGYPRGWTDTGKKPDSRNDKNILDEQRLNALRKHAGYSVIWYVFDKYLKEQ